MLKKSRQKSKYLENEKSFYDEMKSIFFHHFWRVFIEANKKMFFERWQSDFNLKLVYIKDNRKNSSVIKSSNF